MQIQSPMCTRSFLVFRHMMKAMTAALTKKAVLNAKGRSFRRAFLGIAAEPKFFLQVSGNQVVQQKISEQDRQNYGKNKDATFGHCNKTTGVLSVAASVCLCVIQFSFVCRAFT